MRTPSNRSLGALMLALALFVPGPALAGEVEWAAHMDAATSLYRAGDYRTATARLEAALREAESFGVSDPRLATTLNNLALLYQAQGRHADAEPLVRRALHDSPIGRTQKRRSALRMSCALSPAVSRPSSSSVP